MIRHAVIRCAWDDGAGVRFVQDLEIPGLVSDAPTLDALRRKLPIMKQDLLDATVATEIEQDLIAYAHDRVRVEAA